MGQVWAVLRKWPEPQEKRICSRSPAILSSYGGKKFEKFCIDCLIGMYLHWFRQRRIEYLDTESREPKRKLLRKLTVANFSRSVYLGAHISVFYLWVVQHARRTWTSHSADGGVVNRGWLHNRSCIFRNKFFERRKGNFAFNHSVLRRENVLIKVGRR